MSQSIVLWLILYFSVLEWNERGKSQGNQCPELLLLVRIKNQTWASE